MEITIRPMSSEEAWEHIIHNHVAYHKILKHFGYGYENFIPLHDFIKDMFNHENLTPQYIDKCKKQFLNDVYDIKKLQSIESIFENNIKQKFMDSVDKYLQPLCSSWNAIMPDKFEIWCTFGYGSGYWRKDDYTAIMLFRMSRFPKDETSIFNIMFHEFVHMLIEKPIIEKYAVPQNIKERIVDIICYELIRKPVQVVFEDSFSNTYITAESIKTNLSQTVEKMMTDYKALQYNQ